MSKSWIASHASLGQTIITAPLDVCADIFGAAATVAVNVMVIDGKKITYNVVLSGSVTDPQTGQQYSPMVGITSLNGKPKKFDNLDQVVALVRSTLGSLQALSISVSGLDVVRGSLRLSGDPATAAARALAKVTAKKSEATAAVAAATAGLAEIGYYANGNSLEIQYHAEKVQELATMTAYSNWCALEYTRLGGV